MSGIGECAGKLRSTITTRFEVEKSNLMIHGNYLQV